MQGYGVHLLFHLLAIAVGLALGVSGAVWWFDGNPLALWVAVGTAIVGILVLVLQVVYISGTTPEHPPRRPRPQRPSVPPARPLATRHADAVGHPDATTRADATGPTAADHPSTNPPTRIADTPKSDTLVQPADLTGERTADEDTRSLASEALKEYESHQRP